jgi:hypothetical protein
VRGVTATPRSSSFEDEAAKAACKIAAALPYAQAEAAKAALQKVIAKVTDADTKKAAESALKEIEAGADYIVAWQAAGPYRQAGKDYKDLFEEQLIDYVRSPVSHGGGITPLKKIFDYAAVYQIKSGVHGPTDVSPIGHAASLHLGMAIHNYGISEYMQHSPDTNDVFQPEYKLVDGLIKPGESAGLGITYDDKLASQFEYEPAYLPVNRLKLDGTMHDW